MTLKQQAASGVKWSGISMGTTTVLQFVTLAVLARHLSPTDFGLMGMVMVVIGFAQAFSDMGISNAIIHRQDASRDQLSSLYWLNILSGAVIFCVVIASTPLVAGFYREPRLPLLLCLTALIFLITPFGQQFQVLFQKELKFDGLAKIEIASSAINSTVSIGAAVVGFGVLSIIFGQVVAATVKATLLIVVGCQQWRPSFHFSKGDLKGYLRFGLYQMGERSINYLSANIDYIIIGRFLGPGALGLYTLAYQIVMLPLTKLNPVITKVMFPILSKMQHDSDSFRDVYGKVTNYIALLSFPMMAGIFFVAPEFIVLFIGENWVSSINVLQILCLVGLFKSLSNPIGAVLLAKGRVDIGFYWNIIVTIAVGLAVLFGVNWGIIGVSFSILIIQFPLFLIIQTIVNNLIGMRLANYLKYIATPLSCSFFMLVGIYFLKNILGNLSLNYIFAATVISGPLIYTSAYFVKDRKTFMEVATLLRGH